MFRVLLIVANAAAVAVMGYVAYVSPREAIQAVAVAMLPVLNVIYLLNSVGKQSQTPGRLARIINLWFEAKEAELKKRTGRDRDAAS